MELRKKPVFAGIIFLVSTFSFAAGYLSVHDVGYAPIIIEACSEVASSSIATANGPAVPQKINAP